MASCSDGMPVGTLAHIARLPSGAAIRERKSRRDKRTCCALGEGDHVDFDAEVTRESGYLDGGAGRRVAGEIAGVDFVHGGKIIHVLEEDAEANGAVERGAGGFDDGFEILEDALGLLSSIAIESFAGGGIEGGLARDEDETMGFDGLGIGADGFRTIIGGDYLSHDSSLKRKLERRRQKIEEWLWIAVGRLAFVNISPFFEGAENSSDSIERAASANLSPGMNPEGGAAPHSISFLRVKRVAER